MICEPRITAASDFSTGKKNIANLVTITPSQNAPGTAAASVRSNPWVICRRLGSHETKVDSPTVYKNINAER